MSDRAFYLWQVRSFTVRLSLDFVDTLARQFEGEHFNPAEEQGGLLLGRVIDNDNVEVTGFEFVRSKHHRGIPYDLSGNERNAVERYVRSSRRRSGPKPVGYFRTHLRPGLFLDQSDFAVMTESFSDIPGIALAIRPRQARQTDAGIFFWEDGDIDRSQTALMFPFDAEKLRAQGPIHREAPPPPVARKIDVWATALKARSVTPMWGLVWGLAGGILAFATLSGIHHDDTKAQRTAISRKAGPQKPKVNHTQPLEPEVPRQDSQVLNAPPPAFDDEPSTDQEAALPATFSSALRSPFDGAERRSAPPATKVEPNVQTHSNDDIGAASNARSPVPVPLPAPLTTSTLEPASVAHEIPPAVAAPEAVTARAKSAVTVDVSVEPKEPGILRRIAGTVPAVAGHVPLLGRLRPFHRENSGDLVSARPAASLKPRIPSNVSQHLEDEVAIDVAASIDDSGVVRNTDVTRGAQTELGMLAADTVRSALWKPARVGDRNVPMEVVVHYRFNPGHGQ